MNVCPVCRNVNNRDATVCRYCQTALTPPQDPSVAPAQRTRRWPWVAGLAALVLVAAIGGFSLLGGGGAQAGTAAAFPVEVGTGVGASLEFVPASVTAPPNTAVALTFNNLSTLPHNLTFQGGPIAAATNPNLAGSASETLTFDTPVPGTYQFVCTIHPGMAGELVVAAAK